ncbi:aminopeptidase N [Schaalia sp. 19OD2882]|uniref:aminopeptidase N n=1 Tax=Schaalia sp. 19OD2882 TaxID=2794089 RepID=UPI001C1EEC49|nr:aminopeptidase N [Schaalia sp. 19OD2882]QWW18854.1 aminopeptidase N [Schaalia sp. 19OD2882]
MPGLNLTRDEAAQRSSLVSVSHYDVVLDLTQGDTDFRSTTTVTFDATEGTSTFVDLVSSCIHSITLNGEGVGVDAHKDSRIELHGLAAHNTLVVDANCQYMHTGEGLHRFVDPADGQAYCYSQFEVPDARRVYASFEQPDLKATFRFTVTAPAGWKVFSNAPTPTPEVHTGEDGVERWTYHFATTEVMSTYITAIVAGPYVGQTSSLTSADGREIPLGVYCRASLEQHLDAERILDTTRKGFAFFEKQYGIAYPFTKYDQIFVPEYNAGAMENAGCVTFRDQYVYRTRPTEADLETRANTILHELAHMWFGDLVTMKWWNDLWLNESFAEFMSHLALAEGTEYVDAWTGFMLRKDWGLKQDQLPTTHPIMAEIRDLADVEVNFDGITYAKGAAVLRQLVSYVGRDAFLAGLHEYLSAHSYANATLADLMTELEKASGRDLSAWSKVWLEEAGVTLLRPTIEVGQDGRIVRVSVEQESFSEGSSLRPHRLAVAGYSLDEGGTLKRVLHEELDVEGASTEVASFAGAERPDFLLVNDGDLAYAKVRLDEQSLAFAVGNITAFTDSLTRNVVMACAWDMTRDGEMAASAYLELALSAIPVETNMPMLTLLLRHVDETVRTFVAPASRASAQVSVGQRLALLAKVAPQGSDQQQILVRAAARNASDADQAAWLRALLDGTETLEGLEVDVDLRWVLLFNLMRLGAASMADVEAMEAEDDTMTGRQNAAAARAARADEVVKYAAWESILRDASIPNDTRWAMVSGFWAQARTTPEEYTRFVDDYFTSLESVWAANTFHTAEDIVTLMFPSDLAGYVEGLDLGARGEAWIAEHPQAPGSLVRIIRERVAVARRQESVQAADA